MSTIQSITQSLNPTQNEAVTYDGKALLILAGAGSGKTRILTHRIAYLISKGLPSFSILGVTFTNKAANEMRSRVQKLVGQEVWINTFHSTCLKILRMEVGHELVPNAFNIYDDSDQLVLIKECFKELSINDKQLHPKSVREAISKAKDRLLTPKDVEAAANDYYESLVAKVYTLYQQKLNDFKAFDFGDLIFRTVQLLVKDKQVRERYQDRFKHVLIDEYQDTNKAQYLLVKLLTGDDGDITVVGDPDQSIYAWRGADIRNILEFEKDYLDAKLIKLEQNYRSTNNILKAANNVIARNQDRKPKDLWSEREDGNSILLYEAADEKEEGLFIVRQIQQYLSEGHSLKEMVVFYRVHAQSRVIEDALRKYKVPYVIVGGVRFYDRKEIKDLVAYLKVLCSQADEVSLKRIINTPIRGIGKKSIEAIDTFKQIQNITFFEALGRVEEITGIGPKIRKRIFDFHRFLQRFSSEKTKLSIEELIRRILDQSGYVFELEKQGTIEAKARIENIQEFLGVVQEYEENGEEETNSLENFIESITLETKVDRWNAEEDMLTLMTLHTAKGLEFPYAFIVGLEEEIFPHVNSYGDNQNGIEEERRLCYVGITRAMEQLHLSYASTRRIYGFTSQNLPSRFLNEIPSELFEYIPRIFDFDSEIKQVRKTEFDDDIEFDMDLDEIHKQDSYD